LGDKLPESIKLIFQIAEPGVKFGNGTVGAEFFQMRGRLGQGDRFHGGRTPLDGMRLLSNVLPISLGDRIPDGLQLAVNILDELTGHHFYSIRIAELFDRRGDVHDGPAGVLWRYSQP
jgi:hypothetical protein